jgi:hypothetical protein
MISRSPTDYENGGISQTMVSLVNRHSGAGRNPGFVMTPPPRLDTGFRRYDGTQGLLRYHLRVAIFEGHEV